MMCSKRIIFYFLFTFLFTSNCFLISGSKEIVSPLRIAQCRSRCLQKFSDGQKTKQNDFLQGADCFMCWENCELLQANFHIWGSICKAEICYPGCQEACKFHRDSPQEKQVEPVIKARGEEVLKIENHVVKWPRPTSTSVQSPLVYIVMRKNADSSWTQIIQTADLFVPLPPDTIESNIRVLVVNPYGLVTMYSPSVSTHEKLNDSVVNRIMAGVNTRKTDRISINTPKSSTWELKEVSLIHQKVLVLAEVSWEPRLRHTVYLVTWEVDGGGLKGNLFTDSTCVTLSLWPDTIYHIQVEVVSKTDKSVPLVLDTHKATQVSFDIPQTSQNPLTYNDYTNKSKESVSESPQTNYEDIVKSTSIGKLSSLVKQNIDKILPNPSISRKIFLNDKSKKEMSLEQQIDSTSSNLQSSSKVGSSLSSAIINSAVSEAELINTNQRTELVYGSVAAVLLFLVLCVLLVLKSKRKAVDEVEGASQNKGKLSGSAASFQPVIVVSSGNIEPQTNYSLSTAKDKIQQVPWEKSIYTHSEEVINTLNKDDDDDPPICSLSNPADRGASEVQV